MQGKITVLNLRLLGRPAIVLNQDPLTNFVSEKAVSLFCYLVVNQKLHAREALAGLFWGNLTDERAKANLRQALHNINSLCPGYFEINRKTVQFLSHQPHWLDLDQFLELIQSAEIDQLQRAVSLYRDQFMHGIASGHSLEFEQWVGSMSEFYYQKQIGGLQTLIAHFMTQEEWATAAQFLSQLLQLEPWNEKGQKQLMRCYAYQRQFDKALHQLEKCREMLWHHLEVEPTAETVELAQRIRKARQAAQHNIRPPDAPFFGRESDRATLRHKLKSSQIITITGLGGIGKTRLAMQVGLENKGRFLNGVLFVSLAHVSPTSNGHSAIAEAILQAGLGAGQRQPGPDESGPSTQRCVDFLRGQELLLILDNFEHLSDHAGFVADLAQQLPDLTVLITSRQLLNLRNESVVRLDGVSESVLLFHQFAKRSGADLTKADEASILDICRLVDGHPLAIELAADLTPFQSCQQIATQLEQRLETLSSTHADLVDRQKSMGAIFEASWDASTVDEQSALAKLSWFSSTFSADAAMHIAQADPKILIRLGRKSLINFQDDRYSLHPLLRQFLVAKLPQINLSFQDLAETAAAYYLTLLADFGEQASRFGPVRIEQKLAIDLDNFVAAWHWAVENDIHALTPIVPHMQSLLSDRGINHLAYNFVRLALPAAEKTDNQSLIHGLRLQHLYHLFWDDKRYADVFKSLQEIEKEIDPAAQTPEHAYYQLIAGWYFQYQLGEMKQAADHYLKSKNIYADLGFHKQTVGRWLDLGNIAFEQAEIDEAEACWLAGLRLCEQHLIPLGSAILKFSLSQIELKRHNWMGAEAYLLEAQQLSQHHTGLQHAILGALGEIAVINHEYDQASVHFHAQLEAVNLRGRLNEASAAHCNLGRLYLTQNQPDQAQQQFRQALHLAKLYENPAMLIQIEQEIEKGAF